MTDNRPCRLINVRSDGTQAAAEIGAPSLALWPSVTNSLLEVPVEVDDVGDVFRRVVRVTTVLYVAWVNVKAKRMWSRSRCFAQLIRSAQC